MAKLTAPELKALIKDAKESLKAAKKEVAVAQKDVKAAEKILATQLKAWDHAEAGLAKLEGQLVSLTA